MYIAAADDNGGVMLFNYPAVIARGKHYWYPGHSSHVTNCKWLKPWEDDVTKELVQILITAGGHDRSPLERRLELRINCESTTHQLPINYSSTA